MKLKVQAYKAGNKARCADFVWHRDSFLHSSWSALCFGFELKTVVNSVNLVIADKCLHSQDLFCSYPSPPPSSVGVHKKMGGGTADPN